MRVIIAYCPSDLTAKKIGNIFIKLLSSRCYHKTVKIVAEKTENNTFPFLEGEISVTNKKISSFFKNKNFEPLLKTGSLKFITAQDFFSFAGPNKKALRIGTVTGRLTTLMGYCFTDEEILKSFGQLLSQLISQQYTNKVIQTSCRKNWILVEKMTNFVFNHIMTT